MNGQARALVGHQLTMVSTVKPVSISNAFEALAREDADMTRTDADETRTDLNETRTDETRTMMEVSNELEETENDNSKTPEVPRLSLQVDSRATKKLQKSKVRFASTTNCGGCCDLECPMVSPQTSTPKEVSEEVLKKLAELPRYGRREAWRAKMEGLRKEAEGLDPEEDGDHHC